jgi:hypothetical protein
MPYQVVSFVGNYVSNAATRVMHISWIARYEMNMKVRHGLACNFPDIDSDVKPPRTIALFYNLLSNLDASKQTLLLLRRRLKPARNMALRYNQSMPIRNGVCIPETKYV